MRCLVPHQKELSIKNGTDTILQAYSASKAGAEELAIAYENTFKLPILISHTMNVFGERQHPEKYIPMCVRRVKNGETITVHSNSAKTEAGSRHYIHAKDVADAMLFLLNNDVTKKKIK